MKKREKIICNFMLFLMIAYYAQGLLYPQGGVVSQTTLLLLFLLSAFYFVKVVFLSMEKLENFIKFWTALLVLLTIGFLVKGNFGSEYVSAFKSALLNLLPLYAFYYFTKKGALKRRQLIIVLLVLLPIISVKFVNSLAQLEYLRGEEHVVDNAVYMFLGLIPFVFLFRRKVFSIVALLIMWFFIVQSAKRAAIIGGVIGILLFFYYQIKTVEKKYIIRNYLISLFLILGISYWGYTYFIEHDYIVQRMQLMLEGDSAGRDKIAEIVFFSWYDSGSIWRYLFGHGFYTTWEISPNTSHNDWLELLVSFGLVGFFIYVGLFYSAIKELLANHWDFSKRIIFICIITIGLLVSLTSRWYWATFAYSQMLLLPYVLASKSKVE